MIDQLLALAGPLGELLDGLDPAVLDRAIAAAEEQAAALRTLQTLQSIRRAEADRRAVIENPPPIVAVAAMQADPAAARAQCEAAPASRPSNAEKSKLNRARIVDWLRDHQPATADDIALATGLRDASVRAVLREACTHDGSIPWRWSLREEATNAA